MEKSTNALTNNIYEYFLDNAKAKEVLLKEDLSTFVANKYKDKKYFSEIAYYEQTIMVDVERRERRRLHRSSSKKMNRPPSRNQLKEPSQDLGYDNTPDRPPTGPTRRPSNSSQSSASHSSSHKRPHKKVQKRTKSSHDSGGDRRPAPVRRTQSDCTVLHKSATKQAAPNGRETHHRSSPTLPKALPLTLPQQEPSLEPTIGTGRVPVVRRSVRRSDSSKSCSGRSRDELQVQSDHCPRKPHRISVTLEALQHRQVDQHSSGKNWRRSICDVDMPSLYSLRQTHGYTLEDSKKCDPQESKHEAKKEPPPQPSNSLVNPETCRFADSTCSFEDSGCSYNDDVPYNLPGYLCGQREDQREKFQRSEDQKMQDDSLAYSEEEHSTGHEATLSRQSSLRFAASRWATAPCDVPALPVLRKSLSMVARESFSSETLPESSHSTHETSSRRNKAYHARLHPDIFKLSDDSENTVASLPLDSSGQLSVSGRAA